jgi:large subunit ribosomal protein L13
MKTVSARAQDIRRTWYIIDATNKVLGRLASEIAHKLRGKDKVEFTPNVDTGDYIIVINADKVHVTGKKVADKAYQHHTGYPGGLKTLSFKAMRDRAPARIIEMAVKGMLPKGPLGREVFRKLKVYAGAEHPHVAQQPKEWNL